MSDSNLILAEQMRWVQMAAFLPEFEVICYRDFIRTLTRNICTNPTNGLKLQLQPLVESHSLSAFHMRNFQSRDAGTPFDMTPSHTLLGLPCHLPLWQLALFSGPAYHGASGY
jgi:hypothetical protein